MNLDKKRNKEKKIISLMIDIYCKKHSDIDKDKLKNYAYMKIERCPRMKEKTFCSKCPIQCYNKEYQMQIKKVMKYSGKRLIFIHPLLVIKHLF